MIILATTYCSTDYLYIEITKCLDLHTYPLQKSSIYPYNMISSYNTDETKWQQYYLFNKSQLFSNRHILENILKVKCNKLYSI